jgi:hypothetical protein
MVPELLIQQPSNARAFVVSRDKKYLIYLDQAKQHKNPEGAKGAHYTLEAQLMLLSNVSDGSAMVKGY